MSDFEQAAARVSTLIAFSWHGVCWRPTVHALPPIKHVPLTSQPLLPMVAAEYGINPSQQMISH